MNAEIITIGDELLIGQTVDTNSAWMGAEFSKMGISIARKTAVQDKANEIKTAISEALSRCNLLLVTGGLGPTKDDITKTTLCEFYGCGYRRDEAVVAHLEALFEARNRKLLDSNIGQADLPELCETLHNRVGTAPGMWFDVNGKVLVSMPGVPSEMMNIMIHEVIPRLKNRFQFPVIVHKTAVTVGIPESLLSKLLEDFESRLPAHIKLAYLPSLNMVKLRLSGRAENSNNLPDEMEKWFNELCHICRKHVLCREDEIPARYMTRKLIEKNLTYTLAESCTGGFIANQMIQEPGVSRIFKGSVICYANEIKISELGVDPQIIETLGAVSEPCAAAMAEGARKKFRTDIALSATGIAGPGGGTTEKKVGLIFIGLSTQNGTQVQKFHLFGNREQFMARACNAAMLMLKDCLEREF